MGIYNTIYVLTLVGVFLGFARTKRINNMFYIITSLLIVLPVAFRSEELGTDTYNYLDYFMNPNSKSTYYYNKVEFGYSLYNHIVGYVWHNKNFFIFFTTMISYIPILYYGKKYAFHPMIFLFALLSFSIGSSFYVLSFSMMRQIVALGLWTIVLHLYISNDNKWSKKMVVAIIVMLSFHTSSILGLLLLFFDKVYLSKKIICIICIGSYLMGYFINTIFPYISYLAVLTNKEFYLTSRMDEYVYNPYALLPYLLLIFLFLYFGTEEECNKISFKGMVISIILVGFLNSLGTNLDRINMYFYIPTFVAISNGFVKLKPIVRYPVLMVFLAYFTYKYYLSFSLVYEQAPLIPYKSFLF